MYAAVQGEKKKTKVKTFKMSLLRQFSIENAPQPWEASLPIETGRPSFHFGGSCGRAERRRGSPLSPQLGNRSPVLQAQPGGWGDS